MMLEDLYVRPAERRRGVGQRLFRHVAEVRPQLLLERGFIKILVS